MAQPVKCSQAAKRTFNPIRALVDQMEIVPHPEKPMIPLSIGDPTVFKNLETSDVVVEAVKDAVASGKFNGYPPSVGYESAREAIAAMYNSPEDPVTAADVVIASGCSGAIELAISVLLDEGDNILMPAPGFSLYETIAVNKGGLAKSYPCLPDRGWEIDLDALEKLIDEKTVAIIVNNPSNPCGSAFSKEHILDILAVAERHNLPIIADEIYENMVFDGEEFYGFAPLSKHVPILSCGGIAKRFLVPGWRLGWVVIHDRDNRFEPEIRPGMTKVSQLILGANSLVQATLPTILTQCPDEFFKKTLRLCHTNAKLVYETLSKVEGLTPVMPRGAMYIMVGVDTAKFKDLGDDKEFSQKLITEQSVFCLPASVFKAPNFFRIVTTVPTEKMQTALERIVEFCRVHAA